MANKLGERIAIEDHERAGLDTFGYARDLQLGSSVVRWALERADPEMLSEVSRDFGVDVTLDDLVAAAAATEDAATQQSAIAERLFESADQIRQKGLPLPPE